MAALAERVIRAPRTPEARWREWLACRTVTLDELLPAQRRFVVIAPHPDDEVLACGGLLALHAERGGDCAVIAVTDGDASHAGCAAWTPPALAAVRREESACGLSRLGVRRESITRLALRDGEVRGSARALRDALRALVHAQDLVVSTWRLDGHPDHDATGAVAAQICTDTGAQFIEAPVWMWHWAAPEDSTVPWSRLHALALPPAAAARKAAALAQHATQLTPRDHSDGTCEGAVLDAAILERAARSAEYFFI